MDSIKGIAYKLGDDINTDLIISGKYKFFTQDMDELATHVLEDVQPDFYKRLKQNGSIIVAGKNFGCGSSREQAPLALKAAGVVAIVAESFARIFYRNAFNVGLPIIEADTDRIEETDQLSLDLKQGKLTDITKAIEIEISPLPEMMRKILEDGGLVAHFKKHGQLKL